MSLAAPAAQVLGWPLPSTVSTALLLATSARVRSNLLKYLLACCCSQTLRPEGPNPTAAQVWLCPLKPTDAAHELTRGALSR